MQDWFLPTQNNNYKPRLLNHYSLSIYTLVLFLLNVFGTTLFPLVARASDITSGNIVSLTNQEREKYGLPDLKTNIYLTAAAQLKANNMFKEQYWDHFGPNGESPWQFIKQSGYSYVYAGENLAKGFQTSEGVVQAWMASPTHRENLLSGNYKDIGIAAV
ncbi:MAG TPA: CAP domain-containing protein, partial [Candidatus Dojkabacteria bacterium]|nr:CAP domain-containing protein [Candidatus Dojkabacteria bacterium]